jgi:hypothetical protein
MTCHLATTQATIGAPFPFLFHPVFLLFHPSLKIRSSSAEYLSSIWVIFFSATVKSFVQYEIERCFDPSLLEPLANENHESVFNYKGMKMEDGNEKEFSPFCRNKNNLALLAYGYDNHNRLQDQENKDEQTKTTYISR